MLKYEEKLHLDKVYNAMQKGSVVKSMMTLLWCSICYLAAYYGLLWFRDSVNSIYAWNNTVYITKIWNRNLYFADVIYFIIGLLMMWYGSIRLAGITRANHSVREKDSNIPERLVTDGYYKNIRHPMYGAFAIMYSAIFLSAHSLIGLIVTVLIIISQFINAYFEEKKTLMVKFPDEYRKYRKQARNLILYKWQSVILVVIIIITIVGFAN